MAEKEAKVVEAPAKPERRGPTGEVIQDVSDWLNKGCPLCHQPIHTDTPVYQTGKPGLYPALLFHYGVWHEGVTPPPAPHPDDEAALDSLVVVGMIMVGDVATPRRIPYRQAIDEAVTLWKRGVR